MNVKQLAHRVRAPGDKIRIAIAEAFDSLQDQIDRIGEKLTDVLDGTTALPGVLDLPVFGLRSVSISNVVVTYEDPDDNGSIDVNLEVTYAPPVPIDTFDRVFAFVEVPAEDDMTPADPSGGPVISIGEFEYPEDAGGGSHTFSFFLPPPTRTEGWRIYLVSGSPTYTNPLVLYGNLAASPSWLASVDPIPEGDSGVEWTPNVSAQTATVEYAIDQVGGLMWRVYGSFTPPSDPAYRGVRIVGRDPDSKDHQLSVEPFNATAYISSWRQVPDSSEEWTIYFQSIGPNYRLNTIVPGTTPKADVTVEDQEEVGGLKLTRVDATTFDTSEFEIAGGAPDVFRMKIISADKIQTGILKVGGGGSKPGQMGVFDGNNQLVAWAGQQSTWYGIWGKQLWVGGTDPSNAPLYVDSGGNVVMKTIGAYNPSFELDLNSAKTEIKNAYDATVGGYAGIKISDSSTGDPKTLLTKDTFYGINGTYVFAAAVGSTVTYVQVSGSGGKSVKMQVDTGFPKLIIAGTGGYVDTPTLKIGGSEVIDATRNADFVSLAIGGTAVINASRDMANIGSLTMSGVLSGATNVVDTNSTQTITGQKTFSTQHVWLSGVNLEPIGTCQLGTSSNRFNWGYIDYFRAEGYYQNIYAGQSALVLKHFTDIWNDAGTIKYKYRNFDYRCGIVTAIGTESSWQTA